MRARSEAPPAADDDTIRIARKRFARRRLARRLVRLRWVFVGLASAGAVGGLVWLFWFSSVLAVDRVQVHGTALLSATHVREVAAVPLGKPLARVDTDAVQARIEGLVAVESVDVSRCWPDSICIEVTERRAIAVVDREGRLWGLDESGILFRQYDARPRGFPLVRMQATTPADALAEAATIVAALPPSLARRVAHLDVGTVDEISLRLRNGALVVWGSADDSANKIRVLEPLLDAQPGATTYNVSVPGKPTVSLP